MSIGLATLRHRLAMCIAISGCIALPSLAHADGDAPGFDRPGIAFSTDALPRGGFAWEQGLPDATRDDADGVRTTTWVADTLWRLGVGAGFELQIGADSYGGVRTRGDGHDRAEHGGGDAQAGVKWAPPSNSDAFSWAVLATVDLPVGRAPIGDDGHGHDLGASAAWSLPHDAKVTAYIDRSDDEDGSGWLFSPGYDLALTDRLGVYVEAGYGTGAQYTRVAGGGLTWMATSRLQLDASFLRGLDHDSADWQAGIGASYSFGPMH